MKSDEADDRYLVARFASGGVVINLETGNYFRVDPIAADVCDALAAVSKGAVTSEVAKRLHVSLDRAQQIVDDIRSTLEAAAVRGTPTGPYHFYPEENGYGLWDAGQRVLQVGAASLEVTLSSEAIAHSPRLELYVRALAPKIMFLRGLAVLHASSFVANGAMIAFAGHSGAGKTTTAHAFVQAGAHLVGEDLVVLNSTGERPSVVIGAESRVHAWARWATEELANRARTASSSALATMAEGAHQSLDVVFFLDAGRRSGSEFTLRSLSEPDSLLALMANEFLGDASRGGWHRFFATAKWIATNTKLCEAAAPMGLTELNAASARQMSNWTSYGLGAIGAPPSQA